MNTVKQTNSQTNESQKSRVLPTGTGLDGMEVSTNIWLPWKQGQSSQQTLSYFYGNVSLWQTQGGANSYGLRPDYPRKFATLRGIT